MATRKIKAYIATGRQRHGTKAATHAKHGKPGSLIAKMRDKLKREGKSGQTLANPRPKTLLDRLSSELGHYRGAFIRFRHGGCEATDRDDSNENLGHGPLGRHAPKATGLVPPGSHRPRKGWSD